MHANLLLLMLLWALMGRQAWQPTAVQGHLGGHGMGMAGRGRHAQDLRHGTAQLPELEVIHRLRLYEGYWKKTQTDTDAKHTHTQQ